MRNAGREISRQLAAFFQGPRRIAWVEIPLGPVTAARAGEVAQADVLTMEKSFAHPNVRIYEVKVDHGDFLRDANAGKYEKYLGHCCQFYFAAPQGLLRPTEIPEGCGLIVQGNKTWTVTRGAQRRNHVPSTNLLLALLLRGYEDRLQGWRQDDKAHLLRFKSFKDLSRDFGIKVARQIEAAEEFLKMAEQLKSQIGEIMGRDYGSVYNAVSALQGDVNKLLQQRRYAKSAIALAEIVDRLFQGGYYFTDGLADRLREIADQVQREHEAQKEQAAL
ncbi:MAG: MmcB family DNA repair protein [Chloroflexota bacterium]